MRTNRTSSIDRRAASLALAFTLAAGAAAPAGAQAFFYPSFQIPRVVERDYTGAVVANAGTVALFQWREGLAPGAQLSLDAGLADSDGEGAGTSVFVGGQFTRELLRSTRDQPLDLLFTVGAGAAIGDGPDVFRIPAGVSIGHRFLLEGAFAITPYVHPRLSLDVVSGFRGSDGETDLTIDFDLGASFEINPRLAIRAAITLSGSSVSDDAGFGLGLTFTPPSVRR